ncbi:MAG: hypothetical protein C0483_17900 [Pirellula sp.]|nr:hypothetical protein [Pirellula sp.]
MPICFTCNALLSSPPRRIAEQILNLDNWTNFRGYGPLPGILSAEFERRTPDVIGTRIQVVNTDGSRHVEEITRWEPEQGVTLKMHEFTPPLARLATHIDEVWRFTPTADGTRVERAFTLHPRSLPAGLLLRLIAPLLRRAIDRHLAQMRAEEQAAPRG